MPDQPTRPVIWAFSTSRLRHVFSSMTPFLADVADVRVFDRGFEDALRTAREMAADGQTADAFVAAGANGTYLRDHADVPVVVVTASTVDALQALVQARKLSPRIGVVNFQRGVAGLDQARHLLGETRVEQRPYLTPEDARAQVADLAAQGIAVLFISSEIEEVLDVADRILVMNQGRITGEVKPDEIDLEELLARVMEEPAS